MTVIWVLLIFLGDKPQDEVYTNSLDTCLELQQRVLAQNYHQVISGNLNIRAFCIPKKVKENKNE